MTTSRAPSLVLETFSQSESNVAVEQNKKKHEEDEKEIKRKKVLFEKKERKE